MAATHGLASSPVSTPGALLAGKRYTYGQRSNVVSDNIADVTAIPGILPPPGILLVFLCRIGLVRI